MLDFFKKKNIKEEVVNNTNAETQENINDTTVEEEWVWVDGYKGTMSDMRCRDFQYELHKQYDIEGDVKECKNGFHLCKKLSDVFDWYPLEHGNRFFKVKALVKKEDFEVYGGMNVGVFGVTINNKLVAKSIVLEDELCYENGLKEHIQNTYKFVRNKDDYNAIENIGYDAIRINYFISDMRKAGYSELFAKILYEQNNGREDVEISNLLNKAIAFKEEKISDDMCVYLLLK